MSYQFNDEDKEETSFPERMPFGVNRVQLVGVTAGETDAGKDFMELTVVNEAGLEETARVWFVGGASKYSFNTLRQIVVHSAKTDSDKEKARQAVESTVDNDALADLMNTKCVGCELWLTKYYDPERTYTTENGTFRSINKNIYGYEPKEKPELMPNKQGADDRDEKPEDYPVGGEPAKGSAADNIPDNWA